MVLDSRASGWWPSNLVLIHKTYIQNGITPDLLIVERDSRPFLSILLSINSKSSYYLVHRSATYQRSKIIFYEFFPKFDLKSKDWI